MRFPKIRYMVLLGMAGAWAVHKQKQGAFAAFANQKGKHTMASLADGVASSEPDEDVPTALNPFPKGNPTPLPTGPAPGG